jgi:uncharacterized protein
MTGGEPMKHFSQCALLLLALVLIALLPTCRKQPELDRKYVPVADGFLLVLREGDDVFAQLQRLAVEEGIDGATFSGFGFGHATFGYFNQQTKDYDRREFRDVELVSLSGSIAWKDDSPSLHAHGVAADQSFAAIGGHLLGFQVGKGSVELQVLIRPSLIRGRDEALGADVLVLSQ